ncbi:MAG: DUF4224 domain-containing protein [Saccharospirillum sp.]|nr:DUF4224 domain-containing protein [Saccharospirillum sp.]
MIDLLSQDEVEELTGYKRPEDQRRCLDRHGIHYVERKDGKLSVTLHAVHNPSVLPGRTAKAQIDFGAIQ